MALENAPVEVSPSAHPRVVASRKVIEEIIARDTVVYGVSTGFGKLSGRVRIPHDALAELQLNLVLQPRLRNWQSTFGAGGARDDVAAGQRACSDSAESASEIIEMLGNAQPASTQSFRESTRSAPAAISRHSRISL